MDPVCCRVLSTQRMSLFIFGSQGGYGGGQQAPGGGASYAAPSYGGGYGGGASYSAPPQQGGYGSYGGGTPDAYGQVR